MKFDSQWGMKVRLSEKKQLTQEFKERLTIGTPTERDEKSLRKLSHHMKDKTVVVKLNRYPLQAKIYLAFIDKKLSLHHGFTDEDLDFIINYDIKYRMGKELEGEEE